MIREGINGRITSISGDVHRLLQDMVAMQIMNINDNPCKYGEFSQQTALSAEGIALRLRRLVFDITNHTKTDYLYDAAINLGIAVCEENGIVEITVPCLIPKRSKRAATFISEPLFAILCKFTSDKQPPFALFNHCVICITHVYDRTLPIKGRIRDHDNIELKGIIDAINTFLLTDDSGNLCDIFSTSEFGETDMTHIAIMEKNMFPVWILRHENTPKTISHF